MLIDFSQPFLMEPIAAQNYLGIYFQILARRDAGQPAAIDTRTGERLKNTSGRWTARAGVATLNIEGPIVKKGGMLDESSGLTSTQSLARSFEEMMSHSDIKAIIFNIDSPGGSSAGLAEFANQIYASRGKKPIIAYAEASMCSAALWIGAAADEVVAHKSAFVGNLGSVMAVPKKGVKQIMGFEDVEFVSTQSPYKRIDPESDEGMKYYQSLVDSHTDIFIDAMAKYRNVSREKVLSDFGQGRTMVARDALKVGMIDGISNYEMLLSQLARGYQPKSKVNKTGGMRMFGKGPEHEDDLPVSAEAAPVAVIAPDNSAMQAQIAALTATVEKLSGQLEMSAKEGFELKAAEFVGSQHGRINAAAAEPLKALYAASLEGKATSAQVEAFVSTLSPVLTTDVIDMSKLAPVDPQAKAPAVDLLEQMAVKSAEEFAMQNGGGRK